MAIVTVPFVYPVHDAHDYRRYAPRGLVQLFEERGFEILELRPDDRPAADSGLTNLDLGNLLACRSARGQWLLRLHLRR